jgi:hypothetical protein
MESAEVDDRVIRNDNLMSEVEKFRGGNDKIFAIKNE